MTDKHKVIQNCPMEGGWCLNFYVFVQFVIWKVWSAYSVLASVQSEWTERVCEHLFSKLAAESKSGLWLGLNCCVSLVLFCFDVGSHHFRFRTGPAIRPGWVGGCGNVPPCWAAHPSASRPACRPRPPRRCPTRCSLTDTRRCSGGSTRWTRSSAAKRRRRI